MPEIEEGVSVEDYLDGLAVGIDVLELKRLEACGIPTNLALEVMEVAQKVINGTATDAEIVRGLTILTPSLRHQLIEEQLFESPQTMSLHDTYQPTGETP